ncbi:putative zinc finger protein [Tripterygium wilfordii]|uniref:Putative zinc finger protein n=1 Tax=Tripterygium wilfordii TaxID=458696 RepID=A0A7J7DZU5_TRIWF|nr:putative zinc finger protein [Tripterygium wilfordii]
MTQLNFVQFTVHMHKDNNSGGSLIHVFTSTSEKFTPQTHTSVQKGNRRKLLRDNKEKKRKIIKQQRQEEEGGSALIFPVLLCGLSLLFSSCSRRFSVRGISTRENPVHSANALSNRHARSLLCDSCRYLPANLHCLDHRMFICCGCDQSLHDVSCQHRKEAVGSFTGCPLATDFAALWGFDLCNMENSTVQNQSTSSSCVNSRTLTLAISGQPCQKIRRISRASELAIETSVSGVESEGGSSNRESKTLYNCQQQQNACFILQQILDLERLQLNEGNNHPPLICRRERMDIASSTSSTVKELEEYPYQRLQLTKNLYIVDQQKESLLRGLKTDPFPLPFNQLDHLQSCSTAADSLHGESFWQCKSPVQSSQLWPQSMEDLEFCEEVFRDDFNMPDVDLTFQNYEELFGGDMDPFRTKVDEKDVSFSLAEEDKSLIKSSNADTRQPESTFIYKEISTSDQVSNALGSRRPIQPSYSTMSVSLSRLSAESSRTDFSHGGFSPNTNVGKASCNSSELEGRHLETNEDTVIKNKDKKVRLECTSETKRHIAKTHFKWDADNDLCSLLGEFDESFLSKWFWALNTN